MNRLHYFHASVWIFLQGVCIQAFSQQAYVPYSITFFFRPASTIEGQKPSADELGSLFSTPGGTARMMLEYYTRSPLIQGIYVTYTGLVTASDINGQVSFPQRHTSNTVTIVVTQALRPVIIYANTVDHMQAKEGYDAAFYQCTRKKDPELNKMVWDVQKTANPPKNIIPGEALVILARPEQILIREGKTITNNDPNYFLPHVYVKESITSSENAIQFVRSAKFFAPVLKIFSYANDRYASMMSS
jgi:hypothetical protein